MRRRAALLAVPAALVLWAGAAQAQQPGPVLVVGDSLEVGTGPQLKRELSGVDVTVDARTGRPSAEGLGVLRNRIDPGQRVVVFDLGTNDDPSQPGRLRSTLTAARQVAGKRCMVVATLVRPPLNGVSVDGMNSVVEDFASSTPTVRLADWRATALSSPELIGPDRVHATPDGYAARARVVAEAVRSCSAASDNLQLPRGRRARPKRPAPEPELASPRVDAGGTLMSALLARLPLDFPLALLRGFTGVVDGALREAQGSVVPIAPDVVLGREKDPLGKRSP